MLDPATRSSIDAAINAAFPADGPGGVVTVGHADGTIYQRARGVAALEHRKPITRSTVFHVASVSKQVTARAAALLSCRGQLDLDADIGSYLEWLPSCAGPITSRQLAHHTSGLRDQWTLLLAAGWRIDDVITTADIIELIRRQRALNFLPGSRFLYSNTGYTLLAEIVAVVSGLTLRAFCQREFFAPLAMSATHFHDDYQELVPSRAYSYAPTPDGGYRNCVLSYGTVGATSLLTTADDLLRWAGYDRNAEGVARAARDLSYQSGLLNDGNPTGYGFGLIADRYHGRARVGHSGSDAGFRAHLSRYIDDELTVVCLSNLATSRPAELCEQIVDLLIAPPPPPPLTATPPLPATPPAAPDPIEAYAGSYTDLHTAQALKFLVAAGRLTLATGEPLTAIGQDTFRFGPFEVRFERAGEHIIGCRYSTIVESPHILRRIAQPVLTADQLAEFAGLYYSDELDAHYQVIASGEQLTLHRRKLSPMPLTPSIPDGFHGIWGDANTPLDFGLAFDRDADTGEVTALRLTMTRTENLTLRRQVHQPEA